MIRERVELRAGRVLLREVWPEDAQRLLDGVREASWATGYPHEGSLPPAQALIASHNDGQWRAGFGMYQIVLLGTGTVIGDIGFHTARGDRSVEIGYGLVPAERGIGYATEAVVALTAWALDQVDVTEVRAETAPDNVASQRVLGRAGFTLVSVTDDAYQYRRARDVR